MNHGPSIGELPGPKVQVISPTPLRPIDPSNLGQLDRARGTLGDPDSSVATLLKINKDTLRALCEERGISYPGKSQKLDLIEKLRISVSCPNMQAFGMPNRPFSLVGLFNVPIVTCKREAWWK